MAKVITSDNTGSTLWTGAGIDDLIDKRIEKKIKVLNISETDSDIINVAVRQKVNSAVGPQAPFGIEWRP